MSQAKVDRYKEEKANRKANVKKAKLQSALRTTIACVIAIICVGYVAFSAVNSFTSNKTTEYAEVNITDLTDYLNGIAQ